MNPAEKINDFVRDVLQRRLKSGRGLNLSIHRGHRELHSIATGTLCFVPDAHLKHGQERSDEEWLAVLRTEPVMLATDNVDEYIMISSLGDIEVFNISDEMVCNYIDAGCDEDVYVIALDGVQLMPIDTLALSAEKPTVSATSSGKKAIELLFL